MSPKLLLAWSSSSHSNQFWIFPEKITNFILFWGNSSDGMLSPTWHSSLWEKSQNLMFWNSFSIHQSHGVKLATIIIFYFSASHCNQQRRKDFISALFYIANSMIEKMYCWNDVIGNFVLKWICIQMKLTTNSPMIDIFCIIWEILWITWWQSCKNAFLCIKRTF